MDLALPCFEVVRMTSLRTTTATKFIMEVTIPFQWVPDHLFRTQMETSWGIEYDEVILMMKLNHASGWYMKLCFSGDAFGWICHSDMHQKCLQLVLCEEDSRE